MFVCESSMVFKDTSLSNFTTWLTRVESEQLSPESDGWEIHFNWVPDICGPEINNSMWDKNTRILQYWWAAGGGGRWSPVAARAAAASRPGPAVRALSDLGGRALEVLQSSTSLLGADRNCCCCSLLKEIQKCEWCRWSMDTVSVSIFCCCLDSESTGDVFGLS